MTKIPALAWAYFFKAALFLALALWMLIGHAHAQSSLPYCDEVRTNNAGVQVLCALRDQGILLPRDNTFTGPFITSMSVPHCDDSYDLVLLPPSMRPMCAKELREPTK
jgi:hypothetical protein